MSERHVYVDETKRAGYVMVAVTVADPASVRRTLRDLILPGQRRIHMHSERPRRRRAILSAVAAAGVQATIYDAARRFSTDLAARKACLEALVEDLTTLEGNARILIERDDSLVHSDRRHLYELVRAAGAAERLGYEHGKAHEEMLLSVPDIVAWSWVRSGEWRWRLGPVISEVHQVGP